MKKWELIFIIFIFVVGNFYYYFMGFEKFIVFVSLLALYILGKISANTN